MCFTGHIHVGPSHEQSCQVKVGRLGIGDDDDHWGRTRAGVSRDPRQADGPWGSLAHVCGVSFALGISLSAPSSESAVRGGTESRVV